MTIELNKIAIERKEQKIFLLLSDVNSMAVVLNKWKDNRDESNLDESAFIKRDDFPTNQKQVHILRTSDHFEEFVRSFPLGTVPTNQLYDIRISNLIQERDRYYKWFC